MYQRLRAAPLRHVTSLAEVWIEIISSLSTEFLVGVTSLAEVWIEISNSSLRSPLTPVTSLAKVSVERSKEDTIYLFERSNHINSKIYITKIK